MKSTGNKNADLKFFAAHAPTDIPEWFKHIEPPKDKVPPAPDANVLPERPRQSFVSWRQDPCYELGASSSFPELADFEKAQNKHWEAIKEWRSKNQAARYFQWRWFYAGQMVLNRCEGLNIKS